MIAHGAVYQPFNGVVLENEAQGNVYSSVSVLMPTASYILGDAPNWNELLQDWKLVAVQNAATDPAVARIRHPGDGNYMIRHVKDGKAVYSYADILLNELVPRKELLDGAAGSTSVIAFRDSSAVQSEGTASKTAFVGASVTFKRSVRTSVSIKVGPRIDLPDEYETNQSELTMATSSARSRC